jgi:hypothetical protein
MVLALLLAGPLSAQTAKPTPKPTTELPVTRVSLYKNGVGFFEHAGRVTVNQAVMIDFTTAQLDDVLQTLTAIDLQGGRISGADYNSTTPLDQQLKSLSLGLPAKTTFSGLFTALRGTRVEVVGPGAPFTGRLVDIELHKTGAGKDQAGMIEGRFLTIASDAGAIRIFEMTPTLEVRLLDTATHTDLTRYLELLDSSRNQGLRHLTLQDNGTGTRDLRVSYLSEVPIWKSTYRILFTDRKTPTELQTATLQGWSVVDNTTGADWNNVQLSLIAGAPQSFIQPLSQPIYSRRPEIPISQEAQLTPQTHESGEQNQSKQFDSRDKFAKLAPGVVGMAGGSAGGVLGGIGVGNGSGMGTGAGGNAGGGIYRLGSSSQTVTVQANQAALDTLSDGAEYQNYAAASVAPAATGSAFDDFFEYKLTDPITIRKNESALVPILQTKIDAERVTLWSPEQPIALRALWITNTSSLTLDRGSFSIVEDGNFGGEGLLDAIHPGEKRLLSYAADQAVRVTSGENHDTRRVTQLTLAKGILKESITDVSELTYAVHNAAPEARMVILEHPARPGWTLDSTEPKPAETTTTAYRYRVATQPGETVSVHVAERHPVIQTWRLQNTSDEQLTLILRSANASPALLAKLEPVFAAKRAVFDLDQQLKAKQDQLRAITEDQKRLRDNLSALKGSAEERTLAKRYTDELNQQEDQLASLHKDLDSLHQQRDTAAKNLDAQIEAVHFEDGV